MLKTYFVEILFKKQIWTNHFLAENVKLYKFHLRVVIGIFISDNVIHRSVFIGSIQWVFDRFHCLISLSLFIAFLIADDTHWYRCCYRNYQEQSNAQDDAVLKTLHCEEICCVVCCLNRYFIGFCCQSFKVFLAVYNIPVSCPDNYTTTLWFILACFDFDSGVVFARITK